MFGSSGKQRRLAIRRLANRTRNLLNPCQILASVRCPEHALCPKLLASSPVPQSAEEALALSTYLRTLWNGFYVVNDGYDGPKGEEAIRSGHADGIAYGRPFIANPDLPRRLQLRAALNEPDPATIYGGGAAGYTSYPPLG